MDAHRLFHIDLRRAVVPQVGGLARGRKRALEVVEKVVDVRFDDRVVLGNAGGVEGGARLVRRDEAEEARDKQYAPIPEGRLG